jgi:hypothetical protein
MVKKTKARKPKKKDMLKARMLEEFFKQFDEAADRIMTEDKKQKPEMLKVRYVG